LLEKIYRQQQRAVIGCERQGSEERINGKKLFGLETGSYQVLRDDFYSKNINRTEKAFENKEFFR